MLSCSPPVFACVGACACVALFPQVHIHPVLQVMIDGSHAVGSLPLNIPSLGVDMYTANLHKWLCTPKGTAFLWVHPAQQHWVQPVVISHGYDTVGNVWWSLVGNNKNI